MKNVVYQQLQGENKTVVLTVVVVFSLFISLSALPGSQHCQSDYTKNDYTKSDYTNWPVAEKTESPVNPFAARMSPTTVELAGTPADLAPYSYGFYSQIYLLESIYAPAPAAFSLFS